MAEKDEKKQTDKKNENKVQQDPTVLNSEYKFGGGGSSDGSKKQSD